MNELRAELELTLFDILEGNSGILLIDLAFLRRLLVGLWELLL